MKGMASLTKLGTSLCAALSEELRDTKGLMEQLADLLVADETLCEAYAVQLQAFDFIVQRTEESARLLDSLAAGTCSMETIEKVRLNHVQERIKLALLAV